jgi:hypothetical protein
MTIEVGTQKLGRVGRRARTRERPHVPASLPIGEVDANIFACPSCSRPLGVGTRRCPGCGTGLVAGVRASRVVVFVGVGLFTGMIASAGLMSVLSPGATRPADIVIADAPPIVAPTGAPIASAPAPAVDPGIPSSALSALRQTTFLNQQVLADADRLTVALAARKPSSSEIAAILRSLNSTARFGARLAPTVGEWDQADIVARDLATFYAKIGGTAQEGLSGSLSSSRGFVTAANKMLAVVAGLDGIDAASRVLAASANIELPPISGPAS